MRSDRQHGARTPQTASPSVERLESRELLSHPSIVLSGGPPGYGPTPTPMPISLPSPTPTPAPIASPSPSPTPSPAGPIVTLTPSRPARTPHAGKPPVKAHATSHSVNQPTASGVVTKSPHFYPFYTGPRWAELNAVKASARLEANGEFTFTGTNQVGSPRHPRFMSGASTATAIFPPGRSPVVRTSSSMPS